MRGKRVVSVFILFGILAGGTACQEKEGRSKEELWQTAMSDAVFSEDEEVRELVTLTKDDQRVIWDDAGKRVLLLS